MKQPLFFICLLFSLACVAQGNLAPEIRKNFLSIDSVVSIIESRKDLTQGVVDGTDESDNGFTWGAHFFWDKASKQIHKLTYHGSDSHYVFYLYKTILIKIFLSNEEEFYKVNDHFLDISGKNVDAKIKDMVNLGTEFINSIRKNLR